MHKLRNTFQMINFSFFFSVSAKFSSPSPDTPPHPGQPLLTLEEAKAVREELLNIQKSLSDGEQEKQELMRSLACLKDDLTRLQHSESSLDVSAAIGPMEKFSTASQTDISGEVRIRFPPFHEHSIDLKLYLYLIFIFPPFNAAFHI